MIQGIEEQGGFHLIDLKEMGKVLWWCRNRQIQSFSNNSIPCIMVLLFALDIICDLFSCKSPKSHYLDCKINYLVGKYGKMTLHLQMFKPKH